MRYLLLLCAVIVMYGCQAVPVEQQKAIEAIKEKQVTSDDAGLHLELAKRYIAVAQENQSVEYIEKAVSELEQFSEKVPDHIGAKLIRYNLYFSLTEQGDLSRGKKLDALFNELPEIIKDKVHPPSLAAAFYQIRSSGFSNKSVLRKLLHKSIKEQPKDGRAYIILADLYAEDGRQELAIPLLERGVGLNPEDGYLHMALGDLLIEKQEVSCFYEVDKLYQRALAELRTASKYIPDNPNLHYSLGRVYSHLGRHVLSINEIKKLDSLVNNEFSMRELADTYFYSGNLAEAGSIYDLILFNEKPAPLTYRNSARYYLAQQEWSKSAVLWEKFFALENNISLYDRLAYSYVEEQLRGRSYALDRFKTSTASYSMTPWELKLRSYRLGELSKAELNENASSKCDLTEASFLMGTDEFLMGNIDQAKKYFNEVIGYNAYGFIEYTTAKVFLDGL
ncbi:tetratricopeptide repeat protein [Amphritea sp.]|uniref:tetratricopeptide repeat protein n=1 Tax=Amphritea sp. TaxID=1872502 RepID=UPI003D0E6AA8